jgi:WD40 repeat protein
LFVLHHDPGPVLRAHFSRDGRRISTAGADGSARVWDAASGKELLQVRHELYATEALLTSDGRRLITTSSDCRTRVWDAQTGRRLAECADQGDEVLMAAVSPTDRYFATMTHGGRLRVWDTDTALPVADEMRGAYGATRILFLPGDQGSVFYDGFTGVQRIELGPWPAPCPDWVLQLASALYGYRVNPNGQIEPASISEFLALREQVQARPADDPYARHLKNLFTSNSPDVRAR